MVVGRCGDEEVRLADGERLQLGQGGAGVGVDNGQAEEYPPGGGLLDDLEDPLLFGGGEISAFSGPAADKQAVYAGGDQIFGLFAQQRFIYVAVGTQGCDDGGDNAVEFAVGTRFHSCHLL